MSHLLPSHLPPHLEPFVLNPIPRPPTLPAWPSCLPARPPAGHQQLIPLVEVSLAIMRLSCERFFSLLAVRCVCVWPCGVATAAGLPPPHCLLSAPLTPGPAGAAPRCLLPLLCSGLTSMLGVWRWCLPACLQVFVGFLLYHDPPPHARRVIRTVAAFSAVFQVGSRRTPGVPPPGAPCAWLPAVCPLLLHAVCGDTAAPCACMHPQALSSRATPPCLPACPCLPAHACLPIPARAPPSHPPLQRLVIHSFPAICACLPDGLLPDLTAFPPCSAWSYTPSPQSAGPTAPAPSSPPLCRSSSGQGEAHCSALLCNALLCNAVRCSALPASCPALLCLPPA